MAVRRQLATLSSSRAGGDELARDRERRVVLLQLRIGARTARVLDVMLKGVPAAGPRQQRAEISSRLVGASLYLSPLLPASLPPSSNPSLCSSARRPTASELVVSSISAIKAITTAVE